MGITLGNEGDVLSFYHDYKILAKFVSEDGETATGYVRDFWLSAYGRKSEYIEIGKSPTMGGSVIFPREVTRIEPADLEKTKASLLEKYSVEDAQEILSRLTASF